MTRILPRAAAILLIWGAFAAPIQAQDPTGMIQGRVFDAARKPQAEATVSLVGTSLMGRRDFFTLATGRFRFPTLRPGVYELRVEVPGFKSILRKDLKLGAGQTLDVDFVLEASEAEDEQVVAQPAPVVDVRSAKTTFRYPALLLTAVPLNRDLTAVLNRIPGAVGDGRMYDRAFSILGGTVRSQRTLYDGAPADAPATSYVVSNLDVDTFEEVVVDAAGHGVDAGLADGPIVRILMKTGGNAFSGSLFAYYGGEGLSENLYTSAELEDFALSPTDKTISLSDFALNLGGALWEDRAWYFISARRLDWKTPSSFFPESRLKAAGVYGSPHTDYERGEWLASAKLTLRPIQTVEYAGSFFWNNAMEPAYGGSLAPDVAQSATLKLDYENTFFTTHLLRYIPGPDTLVDARVTFMSRSVPLLTRSSTSYTYYDDAQKVTWGTAPYSEVAHHDKMAGQLVMTKYLERLLGANHEFKIGGEFEQGTYERDIFRVNPYYSLWKDYAAGDRYVVGDFIGRLSLVPCPPEENYWTIQDNLRRFSAFLQDSATAGRLTLHLGLRLDYSYEYEPVQYRTRLYTLYDYGPDNLAAGLGVNDLLTALVSDYQEETGKITAFDAATSTYQKPAEFLTFSPSLGAAFDLTGDGKTLLSVSLARTHESLFSLKYSAGQIFSPAAISWDWHDLNQDGLMDLPGVDTYVLNSMPGQTYASFYEYTDASGVKHTLKAPYTDEITAGLERELAPDLKLGLRFVHRTYGNILETIDIANGYDASATDEKGLIWLPYTVTEPGPDNALNTADDRSLTVYGLRADRPAPVYRAATISDAVRKYWAVALTFEKRFSHGWQLNGSVTYSSFKGNTGADDMATLGRSSLYDDPNSLINAYGPLGFDRPLQIKLMGSYALPFDITLGATFQYYSGAPYARTLARVYFPENYMGFGTRSPYATVLAENTTAGRGDGTALLDLRIEKTITLKGRKLEIFADVFNALGGKGLVEDRDPAGVLRSDLAVPTYAVSSTFGRALSLYGVRSFRLGARYSF